MIKRRLKIVNRLGLHARAAAKLVSLASGFNAQITLTKEGKNVNGKSIMGVMMLAAAKGSVIEVMAEGEDECVALQTIEALVKNRFGEER